jgi:hypothetical protein
MLRESGRSRVAPPVVYRKAWVVIDVSGDMDRVGKQNRTSDRRANGKESE